MGSSINRSDLYALTRRCRRRFRFRPVSLPPRHRPTFFHYIIRIQCHHGKICVMKDVKVILLIM